MSLPAVLGRLASAEFADAGDWYQQRGAGRGAAFTRAVQQVFDEITDNPQRYERVHEDVREALVSGYPYVVYYRVEQSRILVLAVFHTSRDPSSWQLRV